jgi:hypothetical protein
VVLPGLITPVTATAATAAATAGTALIAAAAVEVGTYFYKRLKWNSKDKERQLKRQFVVHVTNKQQRIFNLKSTNYSNQAEQ